MTSAAEPSFVTRVRLRARRHVAWLEHQWASTPGALGLSISPHEVRRVLAGPLRDAEQAFHASGDEDAHALAAAIDAADAEYTSDPAIERLRRELELSSAELDLLSLTVAIEADPWLRRAFAYIHDDATLALATPWLARQLFDWPAGTHISADAPLVRWRLARPVEGQLAPWSAIATWIADPAIASALLRGSFDQLAVGAMQLVPAGGGSPAPLYSRELADLAGHARSLAAADRAIRIAFGGPPGAGKRTLAAQLCAELGVPLLVVDTAAHIAASEAPSPREAVIRAIRVARLTGAALYWHEPDLSVVHSANVAWPQIAMLGTARPLTQISDERAPFHAVRLTPLTQAQRVSFWTRLSTHPVPPAVVDWPLAPGDIVRAAEVAPAGPDAVAEACRSTFRLDAGALARPLARPYTWEDLVVPASVRRHLEELETQARLRWPVYEGWGFGKLHPTGRGIAALFAGASGTGKTMAAQVIARSLGMDIYRIDLAGVMSKYIGETEKNLREVFDACERANVLLFFDEADALFGQRMQVKEAHDRFANIEIDYLLQRMEQLDGIAILATNRKNDLDTAFLRRLRFIVDFLPPGIAERKALWSRALPPSAPDGEPLLDGIDTGVLAERLEMTGADIKNAATSAAFLARSENAQIGMKHVIRAARRELAKRGIVLRAEVE